MARRYSIEVTTSRGSHVRQRRFREFMAVHNDIQATLAYPSLASPRKQLPDLAKATRRRMPSGLGDLGELARSWSKDGDGVVKDRWGAPNTRLVDFGGRCTADRASVAARMAELNSWLEIAIGQTNAQFMEEFGSRRAHDVLWLFLCPAVRPRPAPAPPNTARADGHGVLSRRTTRRSLPSPSLQLMRPTAGAIAAPPRRAEGRPGRRGEASGAGRRPAGARCTP